ncbi:hypothetical protein TNCV_4202121 [Trichonephila clavipes]|nr:hypothetical protein TNCV_4202121 [Trichonephila clavipes]
MDVSSRQVSRRQKTDDKPYFTLGGRFDHLKHFKDAQPSLHDCYRAGNGATVFAKDAANQHINSCDVIVINAITRLLPDSIARPIAVMPLSRMENTTFAMPSIIDSHDMGLRIVYSPDARN